jgi:predicted nucleotidyltransferase
VVGDGSILRVTDGIRIHDLERALRSGPPLRLALLFGSAARGSLRPDSDIDVGIVPVDPELTLADEIRLQRDLEKACGRDVDLVRLDRASTFLLGEVARDGRLVLERAPGEFVRFRARALGEWLDFAPAFERTAERFRQRLIELNPGPA